jgi:hypothetical protein
MAAPARKSEPTPPSATGRLEAATSALADVNRRISELTEQRNAALLKDDDATAIRLGSEIDALHQAAKAHEDKIKLLRAAAEQELAERRAREREGLITRIEDKLAARDAVGRELQDAVAAADRAFRKLIDIGTEVQAAWSWPASDIPACLLSHGAITTALSHELYRIGGRPKLLGGQPEHPHAGRSFPGAKSPRFELANLPERIPAITTVLQQATEHASNIMRGKRPSAQVDVVVSAPLPVMNGGPRTAAQEALGKLLKQQQQMVDTSADEAEYKRLIDQIAEAQAAVTAEGAQ